MPPNTPSSVFISPFSKESLGTIMRNAASGVPTSQTWATANKAHYIPFRLNSTVTAYRMFVCNGTTAGGTNTWDLGIYSADANKSPLTRIVSTGTTATSGTSQAQFFDITDTILVGPNLYYMAIVMNGTTDHSIRTNTTVSALSVLASVFSQASASPLPATATPISTANPNTIPYFGLCLRPTP